MNAYGGNLLTLTSEEVADIYKRRADVVYRRCLTMLGSEQDAMDAVQEIFIKVLKNRLKFRGDSDPTTWIYRITTNHVLNVIRSSKRRRETSMEANDEAISLHLNAQGLEGAMISRQTLNTLLASLDYRSQAIVFLHFIEGLEQGSVASVMGISRRAVVKRLKKVRALLEKILELPNMEVDVS